MTLNRRQLLVGGLALPAFAAKQPPDRPSVLLIVTADLPAAALGCYGNKEIRTPNLDRLAAIGTRFTNHFAAAPADGVSRACLLTGRTPMQLHNSDAIPSGEVTIEKLLSGQSYAANSVSTAAAAIAFLDAQTAAKKFALTVTLPMPAAADPQPYAATKFDIWGAEKGPNLPDPPASLRKAAAAITALDEQVQSVIARLAQKGLRDSTLVIFTSSCGAMLGRHGLWGSGPLFDEALATPMIWSWPGRIPTQGVRPELVSGYDLLPSIAGLLSIAMPVGNRCGRSYHLLATGKPLPKKQPWRTTVFADSSGASMARVQRYKLIERSTGPGELYGLAQDPGERINQFDNPQFVAVRTSLSTELHQWKQRYSSL